jgi:hypothetical protein
MSDAIGQSRDIDTASPLPPDLPVKPDDDTFEDLHQKHWQESKDGNLDGLHYSRFNSLQPTPLPSVGAFEEQSEDEAEEP